jgi:hypothetical protein
LERWTRAEVVSIHRSIRTARFLAIAGVATVAVTIGIAWLAPAAKNDPMLRVDTRDGTSCGQPGGVADGRLILLTPDRRAVRPVTLADVTTVTAVTRCP